LNHQLQLAEQYTRLTLDLGGMLQTVWQFDALVTFGAIGWALSTTTQKRPVPWLAAFLVAAGLAAFYALNVYVLWNLIERFRAAQALAHRYAGLTASQGDAATLGVIYQDLPDYVVHGIACIGAAVVLIVVVLMRSPRRAAD